MEAFAQGDPSLTHAFGAQGLGLSISRQILALMRGSVGGRGGKDGIDLWFRVPFVKRAEVAPPAAAFQVDLHGMRILIADALKASRAELAEALAPQGCKWQEAEDGLQALSLLREAASAQFPFHVALIDFSTPEVSATDLARAVRRDPLIGSTPLVLTTNVGRPGDAARAEEAGFCAYLVKPIDPEQLREVILEVIRRRAMRETGEEDASFGGSRIVTRHSIAEQCRQRKRVLVVEDNPVDQIVVAAALRRMGYAPEIVASGQAALEAARLQPFDVIFMDVVMPDLDGCEVAALLREREGEGRHTPIIATTVQATEEMKERCRAAGMVGFLPKPLDLEVLCAEAERWTRPAEAATDDRPSPFAIVPGAPGEPAAEDPPDGTAGDVPVLDESRLETSCMGSPERKWVLVRAYFSQSPQRMERLAAAIEAGDASSVELESHSMRGMCASMGAARCALLFERIEEHAHDRAPDELRRLYGHAQVELTHVDGELDEYRKAA
jgi:CheY-like chemotaxis protein